MKGEKCFEEMDEVAEVDKGNVPEIPVQRASMNEVELLKWENELLRREKALMLRERASGSGSSSERGVSNENLSTERNVMKMGIHEIKTILSEFNPSQNNISAVAWIESIENLKALYEWDDRTVLFYASMRLGGAAFYWYQSRQDVLRSFDDFKTDLLHSFPTGQDDGSILMQIMERKRMTGEVIEDYVYQVAALAKRIHLSDTSTIKYLISGLVNQPLENVLMASNCQSIPDFLKAVKNFEEIRKQGQARNQLTSRENTHKDSSKPYSRNYPHKNTHNQGQHSGNRSNRPSARQFLERGSSHQKDAVGSHHRGMICFKCKEHGHYARDCSSKEPRCFRCQQTGHMARDCKIRNVSTLTAEPQVSSKPKDEYHKIVYVDEEPILAYLDLGSECTTLKEEVVKQNGWSMQGSDVKLVGFGNKQYNVLGKIRKNVSTSGINFMIEIMVVDNEMQNVPMILGRNYLDRPDIEILKRWKTLDVKQKGIDTSMCLGSTRSPRLDIADVNVDSAADESQKLMLISLLSEFRDCFATNTQVLGKTNLVEMKINWKEQKVVRYHPYKVPYGLKSVLRKQVDELLSLDVIQPSSSEYAGPVLLVPKKNNECRMWVDYRRLNALTQRETFPVPNIEETINMLADKKIFTTLDLLSGYHQVPVEEGSRHLTAFITPEGHYEYKRVPFGLTNAPAVFMKLMAKIIQPLGPGKVVTFMDDILVPSTSFEENMAIIKGLLVELRKAGLTLNLKKCEFFKQRMKFLGHEISEHGIKPGAEKTLAIETYKQPQNAREIKQFLGLAGYFRRFVQGFSFIAQPLHKLLKKDAPFVWTEEADTAFIRLKELLSRRPILAIYDDGAEHEVHTDASSHGLAGILMQKKGGDLRPVSYFSRSTTDAESRYHSYELEALAVVESLERFKHYLLHKRFKVVTDCNSLRQTQQKKDIIPRIARWWLKIAEYDFEVEFRPANKLVHADALSRCSTQGATEAADVTSKMLVIGVPQEDWLAVLQEEDPQIVEIKKVLNGEILKSDKKDGIKGNFIMQNERVMKITPHGNRFVIPNGVRWRVIRSAHDDRGHPGVDRTIEALRKHFWLPNMKAAVRKYIASCIDCLYNKRGEDESRYILTTPERQPVPFHTIHIDHLGPFPKSRRGNFHLIGVVDYFTKFVVLRATRQTNSNGVLNLFDELSQYFGIPEVIITDRGTSFTSQQFEKYCSENVIKHTLTTVKTPRSNGQIERYFRTVKAAVATMTQDPEGRDWDSNLKGIQWALNTLKNATTNVTPHQLMLTYKPRDILQNKLLLALHDIIEREEEENLPLSELRTRIAERITEKQQRQTSKFNSGRQPPRKYHEGDLVLIRHEPAATGNPRKVQPRYKGPYVVKAVLSSDRYVIKDTEELQVTRKPYESIQSAERMKPWCRLEDLDSVGELSEAEK